MRESNLWTTETLKGKPQSHRATEQEQTGLNTSQVKTPGLNTLNSITHRIIGAAIDVHRHLGPGLSELLYERAMCIEFELRGIGYGSQIRVDAEYKGHLLGQYRIDAIVEDSVVVEVKCVTSILPVHEAQVLTYLRLTKKRLGLLINFHERVLIDGIRRFAL